MASPAPNLKRLGCEGKISRQILGDSPRRIRLTSVTDRKSRISQEAGL
jgi:hypothetical protein